MKKIKIISFLIIIVSIWIFTNCQEQQIVYEGTPYVRFTDTLVTYRESYTKIIKIPVHNAGPALQESMSISYTIGGTAKEGKDYKIVGNRGSVVILPRQSAGEIQIQLINNANNILETSTIELTLTSASPSDKILVGQGGKKLGRTSIVAIKDECIFSGTYQGQLPAGANRVFAVDGVDISSLDCKNYTINNINIGFTYLNQIVGYDPLTGFEAERPRLNFIDNGNNTLTIPKQVIPEFSAPYDTVSGTGVWNPTNKRISLSLRMRLTKTANKKDTIVNLPLNYIPQ